MAKKKLNPEYEIQRDFIKLALLKWPELLIHGDSGGVRQTIGAAVKMKRMGRIAGWPDVLVAYPVTLFSGLFIEFKAGDNKPSKEQTIIHEQLRARGYAVSVCYSAMDGISAINGYLGLK